MKYISVNNKRHKVLKEWSKDGRSFVEYSDSRFGKTFWEIIGVTIRTSVMENGWVRWDMSKLNKWNPLTYIALLVLCIIVFITNGISGIKEEIGNPFKPVLDNSTWLNQADVKMVDAEEYDEPRTNTLFYIILILSVFLNIFAACVFLHNNEDRRGGEKIAETVDVVEETEPDVVTAQSDELSDWQMFTLALMKVESEYNPDAVSSVGAQGYFQITPIYVEEVNRVWGTHYVYKDVVKSFELSYEVFDLMQKAHNPDYNMKKALELHNGKHEWYNKRVFNTMAELQKYENMRNKIKNI